MGAETGIQWTDATWNPVRGCSRISPGCEHCYAETMAARFSAPGQPFHGFAERGPAKWTRRVALAESMLDLPLRWKKPRRIFVNSMSDLFHESLGNEAIGAVFGVMAACPQHTFQVLTKRAERLPEWFKWAAQDRAGGADRFIQQCAWSILGDDFPLHKIKGTFKQYPWPLPNVWLGVSVEDQQRVERIRHLCETPAAVRFVSFEPLLGPVDPRPWLDWPRRIDWAIIGGESGPGAREFRTEWARLLIKRCREARTAVFFKQLGDNAHDLTKLKVPHKGGDLASIPADLRVREFPAP